MTGRKSYYSVLGVNRDADTGDLRRAYRKFAKRLHPDKNERPGDTELFLEINTAYETLIDPGRRAEYDQELEDDGRIEDIDPDAPIRLSVMQSRKNLLQLDEPQVHYVLADIFPGEGLPDTRPPVNVSIVVDRSTSMRGQRLDQVRSATLAILKTLDQNDNASVVAFGDKAELIVSPDQAKEQSTARARLSLLQAGGGTEIGQGLQMGLSELQKNYSKEGVNHLILLTDGRTYGDEEACLTMATDAADKGIIINGVGIGADWSDRFLDDLVGRTGGSVMYLDTPRAITDLLGNIFEHMSSVGVTQMRLEGNVARQVDLRSVFRLIPDPMPLGDAMPLRLGNLPRDGQIRLLLEVVVHPIGKENILTLAEFSLSGNMMALSESALAHYFEIEIPVSDKPDLDPPPEEIVTALSAVALYQMQEKARHEAELGQVSQAARRLENLATQLLANGERELARTALTEAERLSHTRRLSTEGEKFLKYGTRALLLPAKASSSS